MSNHTLFLIYADADDLLDSEVDFSVRDAASYVEARQAVARALSTDSEGTLSVAVFGLRMQAWFRDLASLPAAKVRREGLRVELEARWGCTLPSALTTEEIRALGLSALDISPGVDLECAILAYVLGKPWGQRAPGSGHLAELLAAEPVEPTTRWLSERAWAHWEQWQEQAGALAPAYRAYRADPAGFRQRVLAGAAAERLGHLDADHLLQYLPHLPSCDPRAVRAAVQAVLGAGCADEALKQGQVIIRPALHAYWDERLASNPSSLSDIIQTLPGRSLEELEIFVDRAEHAAAERGRLGPGDEQVLHRLFGGMSGSESLLKRVAALVVPSRPLDPEESLGHATDLGPWRPWLQAYLPYRAALDRLGATKAELNDLGRQAERFSDWLIARYPLLIKEGHDLITSVHQVVRDRLQQGQRVLWVAWDNLPAHHAEAVVYALTNTGLSLDTDIDWRLALLPSVTKVSLPALLAGRLTSPNEGQDVAARKALLKSSYGSYRVTFQNKLRHLERLAQDPADLNVVHFTNYDSTLHKAEHELEEDTYEAELARMRGRVAERLHATLMAYPQDRPVCLIITSDHGSTRLPPEITEQVALPPGAEEVEKYSSRALRVPAKTPSTDDVCARLEAMTTGLEGPVLLARGFRSWNTPRSGSGYVHGGALPEEVLVPLLIFVREPTPVLPLTVQLEDVSLYAGTEGQLVLTIRNPNRALAQNIRCAVLVDGKEQAIGMFSESLPAGAQRIMKISLTPRPEDIHDDSLPAKLKMSASILGKRVESGQDIRLTIRRALRSTDDTDLFEF